MAIDSETGEPVGGGRLGCHPTLVRSENGHAACSDAEVEPGRRGPGWMEFLPLCVEILVPTVCVCVCVCERERERETERETERERRGREGDIDLKVKNESISVCVHAKLLQSCPTLCDSQRL